MSVGIANAQGREGLVCTESAENPKRGAPSRSITLQGNACATLLTGEPTFMATVPSVLAWRALVFTKQM